MIKAAFFFVLFALSSVAFAAPPAECDGSIKCIMLSWEAPTLREDGTAITALSGYDIYHTASNAFQGVLNVEADSVEYYIIDVAQGNHTFTIRALEGAVEGLMSSPASVSILQAQIGPMTLTIQVL